MREGNDSAKCQNQSYNEQGEDENITYIYEYKRPPEGIYWRSKFCGQNIHRHVFGTTHKTRRLCPDSFDSEFEQI